VALSGTLETFSLPDVLRLLSSTKKTGLLALDGDRGRGRIWVRDGAIVGADADRAVEDAVEGVAFELLRFVDARFEFDSGAELDADREPRPVDDVLAEAESRLAEWREIEAVVPSLDVWARMVTEVDGDRTVAPAQWRVLAQVGTGTDGHTLAERLGQGEYDVCRQLRDLIEIGLVELDEAPVTAAPAVVHAPATDAFGDAGASWSTPSEEPTFVEPALDQDAVSSLGADLASFVAVGTVEQPPAEPDAEELDEPADTAEENDVEKRDDQIELADSAQQGKQRHAGHRAEGAADEEACLRMMDQGLYLNAQSTLETALPLFEKSGVAYLPVITRTEPDGTPVLQGALFHVDALKAYNRALAATAEEEHS